MGPERDADYGAPSGLRNRLLIAFATVGVIAVLLFWPSQFAIQWMMRAYFGGLELHAFRDRRRDLHRVQVFGRRRYRLRHAGVAAAVWLFVVPAIAPRARRIVFVHRSVAAAGGYGLAFAHFIVIPRVVAALLHITDAVATPTFGIASTFKLVIVLLALLHKIIFQTPIVLIGLARLGIISSAWLVRYRRHAIFAFFIASRSPRPTATH